MRAIKHEKPESGKYYELNRAKVGRVQRHQQIGK